MGQYYKPCILGEKPNENENDVVIAWMLSHEYSLNGLKLMEHSWIGNDFTETFESLLAPNEKYHKSRIVWAGDYAEPEPNLYDLCADKNKINPVSKHTKKYPYIINHTKQVYVDKRKGVKDSDGWQIHPLPLLTCVGNSQGGGDFFGVDNNNIIGSWSGDVISIDSKKPKGFTELLFDLFK